MSGGIGEPNPFNYYGKGKLRLPTQNSKVISSFGSILFANALYYNSVAPIGALLTITPSFSDLRALDLVGSAPSRVDLYYKIIYDSPAEEGEDLEGSLDLLSGPGDADGYFPLSQRGVKLFVPLWAISVSVKAVGTGANGATWGTEANPRYVNFKTSLTLLGARPGQGTNTGQQRINDPNDYLPRYSNRVSVPTPFGVVGASFTFIRLDETVIVTYPLGAEVPIPPDAVKISSTVPAWAYYQLY